VTEITPNQVHINLDVLFKVGNVPSKTNGFPGTQGATVTGIQGMGVKTPRAAAVAAITAGFVGAEHMPNGTILTIGLLSIILAAGMFPAKTRAIGKTIMEDGATPKVHCSMAVATTC
jgi:hypothetical protein